VTNTFIKPENLVQVFIKIVLMFQCTLRSMNWSAYDLAWLSAQGRTCVVLNRYSTWNRQKVTFFTCQFGTKYEKLLVYRLLLRVCIHTRVLISS